MKEFIIDTANITEYIHKMRAGDKVLLSGTVFTARDAAHKRIVDAINNNENLPFEIRSSAIYYAGPTPTPEGLNIGSCGPTTSGRMDPYTPVLLDKGLKCMIGKGPRSKEVIKKIIENEAIYLCAIGGAGALACKCIDACEVVAYDDLGCESIKKLHFNNFPLIVAIDCKGGSLF